MSGWYSRPVLFVENVARTVSFYTEKLGFTEGNRYEEDGVALVGQVSRDDCTMLLTSQFPDRNGHARIFIELNEAQFAAVRDDLEERGAPITTGWWGSEMLIVVDPDGNELFFPCPDDPGESA